ncbi:TadE/TadG family type IV pilus assembly protein [Terriglobus sp. TAA 43]|uniref:TadE/TadG family type IV pilus assembly protein n=1 Tax=Terriglobus sp. TAA 43 TaxID=278961 RepID=UPI00064862C8|nr:TadE/TadG family type IV pilus assembly protein [Terriglobus sp. TAA 43]
MNLRNLRLHLVSRSATFALRQDGNSLIETALVLPVLLLLLAGAVDIGRAFRAAMIVNAAARTGAAYGIHYPTDTAGMMLAAKTDTSTLVTVTPTATYGCECPGGGTSAIASCASEPSCPSGMNSVYYVELDTTATYTPMLPWPGISRTIPLTAKVRLRASR